VEDWWESLGYPSLEDYFAARISVHGLVAGLGHPKGAPEDMRVLMAPPGTGGMEVPQELLAACRAADRELCDLLIDAHAAYLLRPGREVAH